MKTPFKTLSFIFVIPFMLLIFPLHSWAEEESSTQIKDIQILNSDDEVIKISIEDIKERLLKSEPVHFVEKQGEDKRKIKAKWITNALKKEYGVEKIDIKYAIITGDLDFHIKENLLDIEASGVEVNKLMETRGVGGTRGYDLEKVFLITTSINVESCQLEGNLEANIDRNLKSIVKFESNVSFNSSKFFQKTNFVDVIFNGEVDFSGAKFEKLAVFNYTSFNGETAFFHSSFKEAYFFGVIFNSKVTFHNSSFNGEAVFSDNSFNGDANFVADSFNGKASFRNSSFNGRGELLDV